MKRILLSLLFLLAWSSQACSYTFNFTDCTVTNRVFVWDNTNSYGECIDLTTAFDILDPLNTTTTNPVYPILSETTSAVSPSPKYDTGLYFNPTTNVLTSTGGYDMSATAGPGWSFKDSDSGNSGYTTPYEVALFSANYISGTSSPNANFYLSAMVAGAEFTYVESDVANSQIKLNRKTLIASGITKTITAKTSSPYTVLSTDMGQILTNSGATVAITFNLPSAASYIGQAITFSVISPYNVVINPDGSDWIMGTSTYGTNNPGDSLTCGTEGCSITLRAMASARWVAESSFGTWTDTN